MISISVGWLLVIILVSVITGGFLGRRHTRTIAMWEAAQRVKKHADQALYGGYTGTQVVLDRIAEDLLLHGHWKKEPFPDVFQTPAVGRAATQRLYAEVQ